MRPIGVLKDSLPSIRVTLHCCCWLEGRALASAAQPRRCVYVATVSHADCRTASKLCLGLHVEVLRC